MATHAFQTDDARLQPIAEKVAKSARLDADDALALYRTGDILAVGWLANSVRERLHGDKAYFNVNRHINPTNVCVAACRLCAFGRKKDAPGSYTMALDEAFETAASGYTEAVTEFHIVGGLHPDLPFQYFLDLCSGLKQRFPQVHLKAFTMVEVAYLAKRCFRPEHKSRKYWNGRSGCRPPTMWNSVTASLYPDAAVSNASSSAMVYEPGVSFLRPKAQRRQALTQTFVGLM